MNDHEHLAKIAKVDICDYEPWGRVERWSQPNLPDGDCSCGCKWACPLEGALGGDWVVCTNPDSHRCGLLTFEHQAGRGCYEAEDDDE